MKKFSLTQRITLFNLFLLLVFVGLSSMHAQSKFNHDYSQTLVMKLGMSVPDQKGGSRIINTFEKALEIIKITDQITLGVPKIIYLVGWQYNGHDDKYPSFFEVNPALKRAEDKDSRTSLIWLMEEAKKYNTTVSFHINMTDAYDDSPLWDEYVENDLISKTRKGDLMVIGNYNNKKAYQINYRNEWNKGYAQMRIDKLLELVPPLKDAATIHLDAWIVRDSKGHYESAVTESVYQKKVLNYWKDKGLDVTSEWVMDYMIGLVPFAWHFNYMDQEGYLKNPADVYTGSGLNPDVKYTDFDLGFLFGKSTYGETVFPSLQKDKDNKEWIAKLTHEFYLNCLQYFYLNKLDRLKVEGKGKNRVAYFSEDVKVSLADSLVTKNDRLLREKDFVSFPLVWKKEKMMAAYWSESGEREIIFPQNWEGIKKVTVSEVTANGKKKLKTKTVRKNRIVLKMNKNTPYLMEGIE